MTDAAAALPPLVHGKHNMASDAFAALRAARQDAAPDAAKAATGDRGPSFADLVDTLNPLQHIPLIAPIYRHLTGDAIGPVARVAGGALYGGPIGLIASVFDAAIASETGNDLGGHMIAALTGGGAANQQVAAIAAGDEAETAVIAAAAPSAATHAAPKPAAPKTTAMATPQPKPASGPVPGPLPQLSAEAFNALVNSFVDPEAAKAANPDLASRLAAKAANTGS